jgi:hypothetical protein
VDTGKGTINLNPFFLREQFPGVAMFMGFPNHFTAESALQKAAGQAENAENPPYFLCEFGDLPAPSHGGAVRKM